MANIKTHLRELSVVYGIYSIFHDKLEVDLTPIVFFNACKETLGSSIEKADNILGLKFFDDEHIDIIGNGINLAKQIINYFKISKMPSISWYGYDSQKDNPVDLQINDIGFSLKEESHILENMGLYKYINCLTNSSKTRGLHIFKEYAPEEYNNRFNIMWSKLVLTKKWEKNHKGNKVGIDVKDGFVQLLYGDIISSVPVNIKTIAEYEENTSSLIREQVVAKWIKENLAKDVDYVIAKQNCSLAAGNRIVGYVKSNLIADSEGLMRLLQIYTEPYYYAKTTRKGVTMYYVPGKKDFKHFIKIKEIISLIPKSQLNIITRLTNTKTHQELSLRNEVRFSHGQFNGTPEAKMYYENNGKLDIIYTPIELLQ